MRPDSTQQHPGQWAQTTAQELLSDLEEKNPYCEGDGELEQVAQKADGFYGDIQKLSERDFG